MNEEIKKYTETFHNTYEMLAPQFGYETRKDTKQFDFDSPNGKLMYATIERIMSSILKENQQLKEQLEASEKARKEAIEFINDKSDKGYNFGWILQNEEIDKLLEILDIDKGE